MLLAESAALMMVFKYRFKICASNIYKIQKLVYRNATESG
jgi:hypothetical protein